MTTSTETDRTRTGAGAVAEYLAFAELIASLSDDEWHTPSRCVGFEVHDVAGHVVGLAEDVAKGVPGSRTAEQEAATVRDDTPAAAAARLRDAVAALRELLDALDDDAWDGPSPVEGLTLGRGVLTLWYDVFVHADDIRAAIGRAQVAGDGLEASVRYLAGELEARGWGPATLTLDGVPEHVVGAGGPRVEGDPMQFVLVATGRAAPSTIGLDGTVNIYGD